MNKDGAIARVSSMQSERFFLEGLRLDLEDQVDSIKKRIFFIVRIKA